VKRLGFTFRIGDEVMQTENNYDRDVFYGDLGLVVASDPEEAELTIDFDGRAVTHSFGELDEVTPAFATTIHKSQGSEYPAVVVPILTQHYTMLARNLVYTGITRGKRLVVIVGQRKTIAMAVRNSRGRRRWSKLRERLTAPSPL
jgi:exodeoxyribonuclease V alpha subunit